LLKFLCSGDITVYDFMFEGAEQIVDPNGMAGARTLTKEEVDRLEQGLPIDGFTPTANR
jgi:hypothetical protein